MRDNFQVVPEDKDQLKLINRNTACSNKWMQLKFLQAYDLHISAQMERENLAHENQQCRSPASFRMQNENCSSRRCTRNSTGNFSVQDRRTTEEGRHELWVFYTSGARREFLFTPNGLLRGQQNQTETNEKKEKTNQKISLNEVSAQIRYIQIGNSHSINNLNFCVLAPRHSTRHANYSGKCRSSCFQYKRPGQKHRKNAVRKYKNKYFCKVAPPIFILGFKFER